MERTALHFETADADSRKRQRDAQRTGAPSDEARHLHGLVRTGRTHEYMAPHAEHFIQAANAPRPARRSEHEHEYQTQKAQDEFKKHAAIVSKAAGDDSRPEDHLHRGGVHAITHMKALARLTGDRAGDSSVGGHFVDGKGDLRISVHHRTRTDAARFARTMHHHYGVKPSGDVDDTGDVPHHHYVIPAEKHRRQQTEGEAPGADDNTRGCGVFVTLPFNLAKDFPAQVKDTSPPHITMLYAGKLTPVEYGKLVAASALVAKLYQPFWLTLDGIGSFERPDKTIVYAVPRSQSVRLMNGKTLLPLLHALHEHLALSAAALGLAAAHNYGEKAKGSPGQQFVPHVTLGATPPGHLYTGPRPSGLFQVMQLECWGWEQIQLSLGVAPPG